MSGKTGNFFKDVGGAAFNQFDSDDEGAAKKTKTQVKKEKAAIAEKVVAAPVKKMTEAQKARNAGEGFENVE